MQGPAALGFCKRRIAASVCIAMTRLNLLHGEIAVQRCFVQLMGCITDCLGQLPRDGVFAHPAAGLRQAVFKTRVLQQPGLCSEMRQAGLPPFCGKHVTPSGRRDMQGPCK